MSDRHARRVVAALMERGVLASVSTRVPLSLIFPASLTSRHAPDRGADDTDVRTMFPG